MYEEIIRKMSLEEKIALCSGDGFWKTKSFDKYKIPSIRFCDGSNGLRKEKKSLAFGMKKSKPATCFPAAVTMASTWNEDLMQQLGEAISEEAICENVQLVLAPSVNMKRNPLCGRNFEYYSEDPFLAGKLGTAFVKGVQSKGVGISVKHFAVNSQEDDRMVSDSLVDLRTLHEYYLPAFETIIKEAQPDAVTVSYNKINGDYACDSRYLLHDILREKWKFEGIVISDWGAEADRREGFFAGLDLEMPGGNEVFTQAVREAVVEGDLEEEYIDHCVERILRFVWKQKGKPHQKRTCFDVEEMKARHHKISYCAATEGAILLKNENQILPLHLNKEVLIIGELADKPKIQGNSFSKVHPFQTISALEACKESGISFVYQQGYDLSGRRNDEMTKKAVQSAEKHSIQLVFLGLPEQYEKEGADRKHLRLPGNQLELLKRLTEVSTQLIVVLVGGGVIEMPWLSKVRAVLHMQLAGQAFGQAAIDLLYGKKNPSGKLAETYPVCYRDVPSSDFYRRYGKQAIYAEGIYVGYRYYEKALIPVRFPFGFGLSYSVFSYFDLLVESCRGGVIVSCTVKNIGEFTGAEVVQVYVGSSMGGVHRPKKELKGFTKVFLESGEEKKVRLLLNRRAFAYYDVEQEKWLVPHGIYKIWVGSSSEDIRLHAEVRGGKAAIKEDKVAEWYHKPLQKPTMQDFFSLYGRRLPEQKEAKQGTYTWQNSLFEMQKTSKFCYFMIGILERRLSKREKIGSKDPKFRELMHEICHMPLRTLCLLAPEKFSISYINILLDMANGKPMDGIKKIRKKQKESRFGILTKERA